MDPLQREVRRRADRLAILLALALLALLQVVTLSRLAPRRPVPYYVPQAIERVTHP